MMLKRLEAVFIPVKTSAYVLSQHLECIRSIRFQHNIKEVGKSACNRIFVATIEKTEGCERE
jgi:hypothetical protein